MAKIGIVQKSKKQVALDAELGLIIDEMGRAMWNANREYMVTHPLTLRMSDALAKFQDFCMRNPK